MRFFRSKWFWWAVFLVGITFYVLGIILMGRPGYGDTASWVAFVGMLLLFIDSVLGRQPQEKTAK
jgi:hypothetical protein